MQSFRRFSHHEERSVVEMPRAPRVLDGQPGFSDPTKAVDRLRLGNRRSRPILELAKLLIAAFEEVAESGEGEVVETGRDRTRWPWLWRGLLSGDAKFQGVDACVRKATAEIYPGKTLEKERDFHISRSVRQKNGNDGDASPDSFDQRDLDR